MSDEAMGAVMAGFGAGYIIVCLVISIVCIVGMWKVFTKAGKPGWASLIPFYNLYTLFDIAWGNGILFLTMLVPCVDVIFLIICYYKLCKAFGKGTGFFIGMLLFSPIFICILGFGDAEYIGPQ
ncbi:MAG: hypothetical protein IKR58_02760 [Lachnospiraceae bacterium]|nr:hypothetical protein [Lachnospiraceae bacterium]